MVQEGRRPIQAAVKDVCSISYVSEKLQVSRPSLYKYMELQGETEDVDADAILAEYEDEDTVSEWAREYVAWMVDQDVMGQDSPLAGADPISRAMVAAMTVRIQPDGMLHGFMR